MGRMRELDGVECGRELYVLSLIGKGPSSPTHRPLGTPLRSLNPISIQFSTLGVDVVQYLVYRRNANSYSNSSAFPTNGPQQIVIIELNGS